MNILYKDSYVYFLQITCLLFTTFWAVRNDAGKSIIFTFHLTSKRQADRKIYILVFLANKPVLRTGPPDDGSGTEARGVTAILAGSRAILRNVVSGRQRVTGSDLT